ncbi:MAG TPA: M50 family metallopeptidase [Acidimicrobiales bacterium]|nr:M50 family metallopeptidase [Acidimicrobiales bacterium]
MRVEPRAPEEQEQGELASSPVRTGLIIAAVLFLGYRAGLSTLLIIVGLVFFIFLHELGHYVTARWAGMKVTEFFIGFGPRIWSFQKGETEYGVKAIPAGAYVRIIGMSNLETDVEPHEEHRTYRAKPYWRRLSVGLAGSTMHFLAAIVLVFTILSVLGEKTPVEESWYADAISEDSPAAEAGLQENDRIVAIDDETFTGWTELTTQLRAMPGESVELTVERDGDTITVPVTLADEHPDAPQLGRIGFLGVGAAFESYTTHRENPITGLGKSVVELRDAVWMSITGLGDIFSPDGIEGYVDTVSSARDGDGSVDNPNRFTSPVGVVRMADEAADRGIADLLYLLFVINVFVGVFNLVPLLPLDGGHVAIATYEKIRGMLQGGREYRADVGKLLPVTYAVFLVLVVIGVTALYVDIVNPIDFGG